MKRYNISQALEIYQKPFMDLLNEAHQTHRAHHNLNHIQKCTLLSIKTGGCPENCSYCPQSAHYKTNLKNQGLLDLEEVQKSINAAKEQGAERFCMGAAWREVRDGKQFDQVIEMVKRVKDTGMEACVTLGMLTLDQAKRLKEAGLDAYNHNLDTGREYYEKIIQTRTYDDRINTIKNVSQAGIHVCSGGILGMGESDEDRCSMLVDLANMEPQPESVPINLLIPVEGTPLADQIDVDPLELVRMIATARIMMPKARIRLSAGRKDMSRETQTLAYFAGASSIFLGDKLLTRDNPEVSADEKLFSDLGMQTHPQ
jgi:biotin synthase